jgi:hypothetical protein
MAAWEPFLVSPLFQAYLDFSLIFYKEIFINHLFFMRELKLLLQKLRSGNP